MAANTDFIPPVKATTMQISKLGLNSFSSQEKTIKKLKKLSSELLNCNLFQLRNNAVYSTAQVMKLFVEAAITNSSPEATAKKGNCPSADDAIGHIKYKTNIESIEKLCQSFVTQKIIKLLQRKFPSLKITIAIDFTPEAFYGDKDCKYVTGYEPKDGTYYCFKFFTVSLIIRGLRYLLFAYPAYRKDDKIWLINRALEFLNRMWIRPDLVLLDREFYEVDVFALMREKRINFIVPAKHDGHFDSTLKTCPKLPAVVHGYELTNAKHESVWVDLVIIEDDEHEEKKIYGYVTNLPQQTYKEDVLVLRDLYKQRWGIEIAHKMHDSFRIKTCCKEGNIRYFFFVVALILYNIWIHLNLLMNQFILGVNFRVKITTYEFQELIFEFFRDNPILFVVGIAM